MERKGKSVNRTTITKVGQIPEYVPYQQKVIDEGIARRFEFSFNGRPLSQKNNLQIRFKAPGRYKGGIPFVGHSAEMLKTRQEISTQLYTQFLAQKGQLIDWLFELDFKFYIGEKWETDLDNMPAICLDAMQGFRIAKGKSMTVCQIIKNDKLLRRMTAEKFYPYDPRYTGEMRTEIILTPYAL
jgi:hypothetical protein